MKHIVITGGNRGIGLELIKQFHAAGHSVTVLCRNSSAALAALKGVRVIENVHLDDSKSIRDAVQTLANTPIDILINNAGILQRNTLEAACEDTTIDSIMAQFKTNALGPVILTSACMDQLKSGSKVICITSRMGSIADNSSGSHYGYRMSKAALNAASMSLSHDCRERGIAVGIIHPGWIQTDMTGHTGNDTPETAAKQICERIEQLNLENSGTFWHANGDILAW